MSKKKAVTIKFNQDHCSDEAADLWRHFCLQLGYHDTDDAARPDRVKFTVDSDSIVFSEIISVARFFTINKE